MARIIPLQTAESGWSHDDIGGHQMPLGERIKQLREEAGWSQGELAERVGTDARQITRYENGRINPSLDHLVFDDIAVLRSVIDGLLAKSRLRTLTADIS